MATQKVIIRVKHKKGCRAIEAVNRGDWDTPWFMHGEVLRLAKDGSRRSNMNRWQPFRCNDPDCPAHGIVIIDWLERLIFIGSRMAAQEAKELSK